MAGSIKTLADLECKDPPDSNDYIIKYKEGLTLPGNETVAWFDNAKPRDLLYADIKEAFDSGEEELEISRNQYIYDAKHS